MSHREREREREGGVNIFVPLNRIKTHVCNQIFGGQKINKKEQKDKQRQREKNYRIDSRRQKKTDTLVVKQTDRQTENVFMTSPKWTTVK